MAGKELYRAQGIEVGTTSGHELHRLVDICCDALVARVGRVLDEPTVPVVNVAQIGEATGREGPDEVERCRARVVSPHETIGIGSTRLDGEGPVVDHVPAVGRQGDAITGLV